MMCDNILYYMAICYGIICFSAYSLLCFLVFHLLLQRLGAVFFVKYVSYFQLRCYTSLDMLCMMIVDENDSTLLME